MVGKSPKEGIYVYAEIITTLWTHCTVLEKTLESSLDCKKGKPVSLKGNKSWIFIGRTDAEAETPILWPPGAKSWTIWKDPDAGEDWRQEETGMTEDEIVGWHHRLNGHEFEQVWGVGNGQGSLACWSSWVTELDTTEWLNWTELALLYFFKYLIIYLAVSGVYLWHMGFPWVTWGLLLLLQGLVASRHVGS